MHVVPAIQHCMSSGSEAKAGATSKGDPPQGGITEGVTPLGTTSKGDSPPGMAAKGNPLHTQANAYMKPKQGDLAYVPASATQKRETQQKVFLSTCAQVNTSLVVMVADNYSTSVSKSCRHPSRTFAPAVYSVEPWSISAVQYLRQWSNHSNYSGTIIRRRSEEGQQN